MKPTKIWSLLLALVIAGLATFGIVKAMIANGGSVPVAPKNLLLTIPLIAVVELLVAIPIFRYRNQLAKFSTTNKRPKRVNPFYAVRMAALAKATAISGALFAGFALSLVILQATLPVIPESILLNLLAFIGSVFLTVSAVVIERFCRLPDDGQAPDAAAEGMPA